MSLNKLTREIHDNAVAKGFYDEPKEIGTLLMLAVSELAEALEADRKGRTTLFSIKAIGALVDGEDFKEYFEGAVKDTIEDEMADALIRVLDMCGFLEIDIEAHVTAKMRYNSMRENKHGKLY